MNLASTAAAVLWAALLAAPQAQAHSVAASSAARTAVDDIKDSPRGWILLTGLISVKGVPRRVL